MPDQIKWVSTQMEKLNLPEVDRPTGLGEKYEFPDDPDTLTSNKLGQLLLRITAYNSYVVRVIGSVESDVLILETVYKELLAKYRRDNDFGKMTSDAFENLAAVSDKEISEVRDRLVKRQALLIQLKSFASMYQLQYAALSRELARRGQELKMG